MKNTFIYLTNNKNSSILAFGIVNEIVCKGGMCLDELDVFLEQYKNEYRFGFLSYDLKDEIKGVESKPFLQEKFPNFGFFVPKYVVEWDENNQPNFLKGEENEESIAFIHDFLEKKEQKVNNQIQLQSGVSKEEYLTKVRGIQHDISEGILEEINFCQEFYSLGKAIEPLPTFFKLNEVSKAPFSSFVKWENQHLLCASPERFIKRKDNKIITQPIKGTAKRGATTEEDEQLKKELLSSEKERAENILTAEAVRKELSKVSKNGEAIIEELCQLYSFKTVHQLISTVTAELNENLSFVDVLRILFPMGSMTGVPTENAVQLINQYENFNRNLYSGSVGYFKPNGNYDFSVVIRSVLYNSDTHFISVPVGGAITSQSIPEDEYEECQIKIRAIREVLAG